MADSDQMSQPVDSNIADYSDAVDATLGGPGIQQPNQGITTEPDANRPIADPNSGYENVVDEILNQPEDMPEPIEIEVVEAEPVVPVEELETSRGFFKNLLESSTARAGAAWIKSIRENPISFTKKLFLSNPITNFIYQKTAQFDQRVLTDPSLDLSDEQRLELTKINGFWKVLGQLVSPNVSNSEKLQNMGQLVQSSAMTGAQLMMFFPTLQPLAVSILASNAVLRASASVYNIAMDEDIETVSGIATGISGIALGAILDVIPGNFVTKQLIYSGAAAVSVGVIEDLLIARGTLSGVLDADSPPEVIAKRVEIISKYGTIGLSFMGIARWADDIIYEGALIPANNVEVQPETAGVGVDSDIQDNSLFFDLDGDGEVSPVEIQLMQAKIESSDLSIDKPAIDLNSSPNGNHDFHFNGEDITLNRTGEDDIYNFTTSQGNDAGSYFLTDWEQLDNGESFASVYDANGDLYGFMVNGDIVERSEVGGLITGWIPDFGNPDSATATESQSTVSEPDDAADNSDDVTQQTNDDSNGSTRDAAVSEGNGPSQSGGGEAFDVASYRADQLESQGYVSLAEWSSNPENQIFNAGNVNLNDPDVYISAPNQGESDYGLSAGDDIGIMINSRTGVIHDIRYNDVGTGSDANDHQLIIGQRLNPNGGEFNLSTYAVGSNPETAQFNQEGGWRFESDQVTGEVSIVSPTGSTVFQDVIPQSPGVGGGGFGAQAAGGGVINDTNLEALGTSFGVVAGDGSFDSEYEFRGDFHEEYAGEVNEDIVEDFNSQQFFGTLDVIEDLRDDVDNIIADNTPDGVIEENLQNGINNVEQFQREIVGNGFEVATEAGFVDLDADTFATELPVGDLNANWVNGINQALDAIDMTVNDFAERGNLEFEDAILLDWLAEHNGFANPEALFELFGRDVTTADLARLAASGGLVGLAGLLLWNGTRSNRAQRLRGAIARRVPQSVRNRFPGIFNTPAVAQAQPVQPNNNQQGAVISPGQFQQLAANPAVATILTPAQQVAAAAGQNVNLTPAQVQAFQAAGVAIGGQVPAPQRRQVQPYSTGSTFTNRELGVSGEIIDYDEDNDIYTIRTDEGESQVPSSYFNSSDVTSAEAQAGLDSIDAEDASDSGTVPINTEDQDDDSSDSVTDTEEGDNLGDSVTDNQQTDDESITEEELENRARARRLRIINSVEEHRNLDEYFNGTGDTIMTQTEFDTLIGTYYQDGTLPPADLAKLQQVERQMSAMDDDTSGGSPSTDGDEGSGGSDNSENTSGGGDTDSSSQSSGDSATDNSGQGNTNPVSVGVDGSGNPDNSDTSIPEAELVEPTDNGDSQPFTPASLNIINEGDSAFPVRRLGDVPTEGLSAQEIGTDSDREYIVGIDGDRNNIILSRGGTLRVDGIGVIEPPTGRREEWVYNNVNLSPEQFQQVFELTSEQYSTFIANQNEEGNQPVNPPTIFASAQNFSELNSILRTGRQTYKMNNRGDLYVESNQLAGVIDSYIKVMSNAGKEELNDFIENKWDHQNIWDVIDKAEAISFDKRDLLTDFSDDDIDNFISNSLTASRLTRFLRKVDSLRTYTLSNGSTLSAKQLAIGLNNIQKKLNDDDKARLDQFVSTNSDVISIYNEALRLATPSENS